ncbi:MAG: HK97 gp10 family phage protein [Ruminococcus flavefaciens]|nr:HK97 gp10 family phage protein [Ruminococcus flavefaciens]
MAGSSATSTQSVQNAKRQLQKFLRKLDTIPTQILQDEAQKLKAEIIAETPYETGKLESSVRVTVSRDKRRPGLNASALARSTSRYNYAGIQHEREDFAHPVKGKAHFISDPFKRATERIEKRMREELTLDD